VLAKAGVHHRRRVLLVDLIRKPIVRSWRWPEKWNALREADRTLDTISRRFAYGAIRPFKAGRARVSDLKKSRMFPCRRARNSAMSNAS